MTRETNDPPRSKTFLKATARFGDGALTVECVVREISASSALLQLAEGAVLPDVFELDIPQRGSSFRCELKERHGDKAVVGLSLLDDGSSDAGGDPWERIRVLERENAALKREMARLREALDDGGSAI